MENNKVTIYTIAEELNMTPSMVSHAFKPDGKVNAKKRKLILETAERMGFEQNKMASLLSMKPIRIATLIYGRFPGYYNEMVRGVEAARRDLSDYKVTNSRKRNTTGWCCTACTATRSPSASTRSVRPA